MDEKKVVDEKLISEVWQKYLTQGLSITGMNLPWYEHPFFKPIFRAIPSDPRCQMCYIPFEGLGGFIAKRFLDVKPSGMNPHLCDTCERFAERHPGGAEVETTVLFVDIRGSTPLAEKMGTREYSELVHRFYHATTRPLFKNYAFLEKFIGDGLTAFFPPAFAGPNHAATAIKAAREVLIATGHGENKVPWIPVGIGINSGVAYIGAVKSAAGRTDITLLGDVVNTAARLCAEAAAGEIIIGSDAKRSSGLTLEGSEIRQLQLKGKTNPVEAYVINI